jgi:ribosome-associated protein
MDELDYDYDYEYDENGNIIYYAVRPNKTQLKKEFAELFALGEEMSKLTSAQLTTLELPEKIHNAVSEAMGMQLNGARKRLLKFIAAQLHKIDIEPIVAKLDRIRSKSVHAVREHHLAERWRDRLVAEGNDALTELLDEMPLADRQQLRQLMRNAQKEAETSKPPKSSRLLYRYLKGLFAEETIAETELLQEDIIDNESIDDEDED